MGGGSNPFTQFITKSMLCPLENLKTPTVALQNPLTPGGSGLCAERRHTGPQKQLQRRRQVPGCGNDCLAFLSSCREPPERGVEENEGGAGGWGAGWAGRQAEGVRARETRGSHARRLLFVHSALPGRPHPACLLTLHCSASRELRSLGLGSPRRGTAIAVRPWVTPNPELPRPGPTRHPGEAEPPATPRSAPTSCGHRPSSHWASLSRPPSPRICLKRALRGRRHLPESCLPARGGVCL